MKLDGKIALVTRATSGTALATAALFHSEGAQAVVVGNDPDRPKTAAAPLGESVVVVQADLRRPADIDRLIETVRERYGRLDILFANAGLGRAAPLEAVTEAQIDEQLTVNFKGLFFTVQKAL